MQLIDMKRPKKTKAQLKTYCDVPAGNDEQYPWGLKITLDKDEIAKIKGLEKIPAGATVNISAVGKIIEVAITNKDTEKTRHRIEIQIQQIGISGTGRMDKDDADAAFDKGASGK